MWKCIFVQSQNFASHSVLKYDTYKLQKTTYNKIENGKLTLSKTINVIKLKKVYLWTMVSKA